MVCILYQFSPNTSHYVALIPVGQCSWPRASCLLDGSGGVECYRVGKSMVLTSSRNCVSFSRVEIPPPIFLLSFTTFFKGLTSNSSTSCISSSSAFAVKSFSSSCSSTTEPKGFYWLESKSFASFSEREVIGKLFFELLPDELCFRLGSSIISANFTF